VEKTDSSQEQALAGLRDGLVIVALRALGDDDRAQDAVQEALSRVLRVLRATGIPPAYSLESYAYGTLRHVIGDLHRSQRRFTLLPRWLTAPAESTLEALIAAEHIAKVRQGLAQLGSADRELLQRCYVAGERVAEIARVCGEPAERIRKRKSRALERLRQLLDAESHTPPSKND
jgi:RNA polymerase sigma factor (sigma-70 family)